MRRGFFPPSAGRPHYSRTSRPTDPFRQVGLDCFLPGLPGFWILRIRPSQRVLQQLFGLQWMSMLFDICTLGKSLQQLSQLSFVGVKTTDEPIWI